jgi:uncharacterized repeat protein (TIGR03803 family)
LSGAARASTYKIIHEFEVPNYPQGNLTIDAAGNLYGTTFGGGSATCTSGPVGGCGVVWKLAPNGILTMLHKFTGGSDGAHPAAGLTLDAAGNLYGTTSAGGDVTACPSTDPGIPGGCGVVFGLKPNSHGGWTESVLHTFAYGADGANPAAGLIFDAAGNLYGTTSVGGDPTACPSLFPAGLAGCGIAFKLKPNADGTWTESILHTFNGGAGGTNPSGGLIFDAAGNLYGTTSVGGNVGGCGSPEGSGVVFKLAPNPDGTWTESVLHSFGGDGCFAQGGVIFDSAGNLYGTTSGNPNGTVFKLAPNPDGTWVESTLYSFFDKADGLYPNGGLVFDAVGNLYGTTYFGGRVHLCNDDGCGVVFKLTPTSSGSWSETVLRKFLGRAANPFAPVIFDNKGNLYGTTSSGTGNNGVVFKITP